MSTGNLPAEGGTSKKVRKTRGKKSKTAQATAEANPTEMKHKTTKKKKRQKKKAEATGPLYWRNENDKLVLSRSFSPLFRFTVRGNPRPLVRHRTGRGFLYNPSAPAQAEFRSVVEDLIQLSLGVQPMTLEQADKEDDAWFCDPLPVDPSEEEQQQNDPPVSLGVKLMTLEQADEEDDVWFCDPLPVDPSEEEQQQNDPVSADRHSVFPPQLPLFHSDVLLVMTIIFRLRRPNIHFIANKRGTNRLKASAPTENSPIRKDVDNLAKFVLDAMNGVLYEDDKQVASLHITKLYDNDDCCEGSTEVLLQALEDDDIHSLIMNSFQPCRRHYDD